MEKIANQVEVGFYYIPRKATQEMDEDGYVQNRVRVKVMELELDAIMEEQATKEVVDWNC